MSKNNFIDKIVLNSVLNTPSNSSLILYNSEVQDKITKEGMERIRNMINKMDDPLLTRHEKIGDTVFPVTYSSSGLVFVDYPIKVK